MTFTKPTNEQLTELLESATTIAIVGASTDESKAANQIPQLLVDAGFTVIPVNPGADEIVGQKAYPSLADVPVPVDIVDVFRPADEAGAVAEQAAAIGAKTLWLQLGIASAEARAAADSAAMNYVEDNCLGATVAKLRIRK